MNPFYPMLVSRLPMCCAIQSWWMNREQAWDMFIIRRSACYELYWNSRVNKPSYRDNTWFQCSFKLLLWRFHTNV